jgi:predicted transposase YbfD/YdcC
VGRETWTVDWKALRTPLGLPGQTRALCTRTSFVALSEPAEPKAPEVRFYASSAPSERITDDELKSLGRDHWKIENQLHHVKDRTWHEDRHWIKNSKTAAATAMLRSVACCLVLQAPGKAMKTRIHCPERIEYFNLYPNKAIKLLAQPLRL